MAARKNLKLTDQHRERIRTSMLINRLQDFIDGKVEMVPHQVTAALGLLKKTMPDLKENQHTGEGGNGPVRIVVETGVRRSGEG